MPMSLKDSNMPSTTADQTPRPPLTSTPTTAPTPTPLSVPTLNPAHALSCTKQAEGNQSEQVKMDPGSTSGICASDLESGPESVTACVPTEPHNIPQDIYFADVVEESQAVPPSTSFTPSTSTSIPSSAFQAVSVSTLACLTLVAEQQELLAVSSAALKDALDRLSRSRVEEEMCSKKAQLEESRTEETTEWMVAMQGVLWPENVSDRELGRPTLPERPALLIAAERKTGRPKTLDSEDCVTTDVEGMIEGGGGGGIQGEVTEGEKEAETALYPFFAPVPPPPSTPSRATQSYSESKDYLMYGMSNALSAARMLMILEVVDVDTIMEAFRWMSWCYRCLHVLRIPPATHTLQRLLAGCKPFKLADDKIVKAISGILSRSTAWKGKVRKLLLPSTRTPSTHRTRVVAGVESARLHSLIVEGAMVPMTSKLKHHVSTVWDGLVTKAATTPSSSSSSSSSSINEAPGAATGKPKRGSKIPAIPGIPGIAKYVTISMSADTAESSDEEEEGVGEEEVEEMKGKRETEREGKRGEGGMHGGEYDDHHDMMTDNTAIPSSSSSSSHVREFKSRARRKVCLADGSGLRDTVYTPLCPSMWSPLPSLWPPVISVKQISAKRATSIDTHSNSNTNTNTNNSNSNTTTVTTKTTTSHSTTTVTSKNNNNKNTGSSSKNSGGNSGGSKSDHNDKDNARSEINSNANEIKSNININNNNSIVSNDYNNNNRKDYLQNNDQKSINNEDCSINNEDCSKNNEVSSNSNNSTMIIDDNEDIYNNNDDDEDGDVEYHRNMDENGAHTLSDDAKLRRDYKNDISDDENENYCAS